MSNPGRTRCSEIRCASYAHIPAGRVPASVSASAVVTRLADATAQIGDVTTLIANIAGQTNLLALNATIEAARAGEAGKGFAVVANEVKELAASTASATGNIRGQIEGIQKEAYDAAQAIEKIGQMIGDISGIQQSIAAAVEEQSTATGEIGRNVEEAFRGSSEIAENVTGVSQAAQSTASGATQTQAAAQELARMAASLQSLVAQFKYDSPARSENRLAA